MSKSLGINTPGSLGNRVSPPAYSNVPTTNRNTMSPPNPSQTSNVIPNTPTGTTVDRWGNTQPAVGAQNASMLPMTGTILDTTAFTAGGIDFTYLLLLVIAAVVVIALVLLR